MTSYQKSSIVLLGAPNHSNRNVSPELKELGIDRLRLSPSSVRYEVIPDAEQPHFAMYRSLLPAFMLSNDSSKRVDLNSQGFPLEYSGTLLPFPYPNLIVNWDLAPPEEVIADLKRKFMAVPVEVRGKMCLSIPNITLAILPSIAQYKVATITPTVDDHMNLSSARSLVVILKILSSFLTTHTYPAFEDDKHVISFNAALAEVVTGKDMEVDGMLLPAFHIQ